jgi:hypothetical protein
LVVAKLDHQNLESRYCAPARTVTSTDPADLFCFDPTRHARERFEKLLANSFDASLLLNSATSAAKMYRLFAIKCVRSHPRFS